MSGLQIIYIKIVCISTEPIRTLTVTRRTATRSFICVNGRLKLPLGEWCSVPSLPDIVDQTTFGILHTGTTLSRWAHSSGEANKPPTVLRIETCSQCFQFREACWNGSLISLFIYELLALAVSQPRSAGNVVPRLLLRNSSVRVLW